MRWQPLRLIRSSSKLSGIETGLGLGLGNARSLQEVVSRRLSSKISASPTIASILATPPAGDGGTITVVGSVRTIRNQKHWSFVEIGDGSTVHPLQALLQPSQAQGLVYHWRVTSTVWN